MATIAQKLILKRRVLGVANAIAIKFATRRKELIRNRWRVVHKKNKVLKNIDDCNGKATDE